MILLGELIWSLSFVQVLRTERRNISSVFRLLTLQLEMWYYLCKRITLSVILTSAILEPWNHKSRFRVFKGLNGYRETHCQVFLAIIVLYIIILETLRPRVAKAAFLFSTLCRITRTAIFATTASSRCPCRVSILVFSPSPRLSFITTVTT